MIVLIGMTVVAASVADGTEEAVTLKDCPKVVQKTLKRESKAAKIVEIEKEEVDGKTIYEAEVMIDGKEYDVAVAPCGTLLSKILEGAEEEDGEEADAEEEEEEVEVKLADLPKSVRKTLMRESGGGAIEEIEREQEGGKTVFEAEVEIDEREYEIEIAKDGTLLSKVLEDDGEEEEGDDEEDEGEEDDDGDDDNEDN